MDKKVILRENIKFLVNAGDSREQVKAKIKKSYGTKAPCDATIYKWYSFFVRGGESSADRQRSGRPVQPVNPRLLTSIKNLIDEDPKISLGMIATLTAETKSYIQKTIQERTDLKFVIARWVPKLLDKAQKKVRVNACKRLIEDYGSDWDNLYENLVTVDETWIYFKPRENLRSAGEWQAPGQRPPEVGRLGLTSQKVMLSVFWNSKGVIHADYLRSGRSINKEYYSELLKIVNFKIPVRKRNKVIFLQDNAPAHKAKVNIDLILSFGWKLIDHPPYSPDLSPSDFYLFKCLKNDMFKSHFATGIEAEVEVNAYLAEKSPEWFYHGIEMYKDQIEACIKNKGDY